MLQRAIEGYIQVNSAVFPPLLSSPPRWAAHSKRCRNIRLQPSVLLPSSLPAPSQHSKCRWLAETAATLRQRSPYPLLHNTSKFGANNSPILTICNWLRRNNNNAGRLYCTVCKTGTDADVDANIKTSNAVCCRISQLARARLNWDLEETWIQPKFWTN